MALVSYLDLTMSAGCSLVMPERAREVKNLCWFCSVVGAFVSWSHAGSVLRLTYR